MSRWDVRYIFHGANSKEACILVKLTEVCNHLMAVRGLDVHTATHTCLTQLHWWRWTACTVVLSQLSHSCCRRRNVPSVDTPP
jgi:hypothetical protein